MLVVPEREIADLMTRDAAFDAVEKVFAAMAAGDATNFPVVREAIGHEDALYGFKGGFDRAVPGHCDPTANVHDWYVGVRGGKVETLWPVSARGKAY